MFEKCAWQERAGHPGQQADMMTINGGLGIWWERSDNGLTVPDPLSPRTGAAAHTASP